MHFIRKISFTKGWLKEVILGVFSIWIGIITLGALNDTNLNPWGLTSYVPISFSLFIFLLILIKKTKLIDLIKKYQNILIFLLIIFSLSWQIIIILKLSSFITWDVGSIHLSLTDKKTRNSYLSLNPNNSFLFYFQYYILNLLGFNKSSWIIINFINMICIDFSFLINILSIKLIKPSAIKVLMIIQSIAMILLIQIISPYSDTMVLPFVSLILLGFTIIEKNSNIKIKYIGNIIMSISTLISYLMKPSAIIPAIAIILWIIINFLKTKKNKKIIFNCIVMSLMFISVFVGGNKLYNQFLCKNSISHIKHGLSEPANHFIAIGLSGNGAYSGDEAIKTYNMKTIAERKRYSNKVIINNIKKRGIFGNIQFLIAKNYSNTSDGTFAWYRIDTGPIVNSPINGKLKNIFYQNGAHFHDYQFIAQLFFISILIILLLGFTNITNFTQILRLSLLGSFTFLLIFEGGRSRYLIQFLPTLFLLAALNFKYSTRVMKNIIHTIKISK